MSSLRFGSTLSRPAVSTGLVVGIFPVIVYERSSSYVCYSREISFYGVYPDRGRGERTADSESGTRQAETQQPGASGNLDSDRR
jgi:hypothetical protein